MSGIRRVVLAAALMSLFAVVSSAAGAVTWDNSGSTSFTATGGPATLSVGATNFPCADATLTGTSPTSSLTPDIATGVATFTSCTLGGAPAHETCVFTITALSQLGGSASGNMDTTCDLSLFGVTACHVAGTTPVTYINPSGSVKGRLALAHSSGTLRVFNPAGGTCLLGNNVAATLTSSTFTITAANGAGNGPVITRTP